MIRKCTIDDIGEIIEIINDAAEAYRGVIPEDRWQEPYMSKPYLTAELDDGVIFHGLGDIADNLLGVVGIQDKDDVSLIRHAYVRTLARRQGIGGQLLNYITKGVEKPLLVGTWKAAVWAISFYEKHGFKAVDRQETERLLKTYWSIPKRQIDTSIVLADDRWRAFREKPILLT